MIWTQKQRDATAGEEKRERYNNDNKKGRCDKSISLTSSVSSTLIQKTRTILSITLCLWRGKKVETNYSSSPKKKRFRQKLQTCKSVDPSSCWNRHLKKKEKRMLTWTKGMYMVGGQKNTTKSTQKGQEKITPKKEERMNKWKTRLTFLFFFFFNRSLSFCSVKLKTKNLQIS